MTHPPERWHPRLRRRLLIPSTVDLKPLIKAIFGQEEEVSVEAVRDVIESLSYRQQVVVVRYHGLDGQRRLTMREIGDEFQVGRSRIGQIHAKALEKLHRPICIEILRGGMNWSTDA